MIEQVFERAIRLAESRCDKADPLLPMLVIAGRQGEAVLTLSFEPPSERDRLAEKARVMATALEARACICIFESEFLVAGQPSSSMIVAVTEDRERSGAMALFAREKVAGRTRLTPVATGLGGRTPERLGDFLASILPDRPSGADVEAAWRRLEAMGVTINSGDRALH